MSNETDLAWNMGLAILATEQEIELRKAEEVEDE